MIFAVRKVRPSFEPNVEDLQAQAQVRIPLVSLFSTFLALHFLLHFCEVERNYKCANSWETKVLSAACHVPPFGWLCGKVLGRSGYVMVTRCVAG